LKVIEAALVGLVITASGEIVAVAAVRSVVVVLTSAVSGPVTEVAASVTEFAASVTMTVPGEQPVMVKVAVVVAVVAFAGEASCRSPQPVAVPVTEKSVAVMPMTLSEKVAV
jgi:hypothetical protein